MYVAIVEVVLFCCHASFLATINVVSIDFKILRDCSVVINVRGLLRGWYGSFLATINVVGNDVKILCDCSVVIDVRGPLQGWYGSFPATINVVSNDVKILRDTPSCNFWRFPAILVVWGSNKFCLPPPRKYRLGCVRLLVLVVLVVLATSS